MRRAMLIAAILLQAVTLAVPALAQQTCPDTCPDGMIRNTDTGKCEPYTPMV